MYFDDYIAFVAIRSLIKDNERNSQTIVLHFQ